MLKKMTALLLSLSMSLMMTFAAYADPHNTVKKESYEIGGYILEENTYGSDATVYVKDSSGVVMNTITRINGKVYLDGLFLGEVSDGISLTTDGISLYANDITWGPWQQTVTTSFKTGGLATAVIAGLLAAFCPYLGVKVVGVIASAAAGKYDEISFYADIRYGSDSSDIGYYERKTYFYGDGKLFYTAKDSGILD